MSRLYHLQIDVTISPQCTWTMLILLSVEKLLDIELPDRVEYIRVIVSELQRIASHLVAIGAFGLDVGAITPFTWALRDRERVLDLFEAIMWC